MSTPKNTPPPSPPPTHESHDSDAASADEADINRRIPTPEEEVAAREARKREDEARKARKRKVREEKKAAALAMEAAEAAAAAERERADGLQRQLDEMRAQFAAQSRGRRSGPVVATLAEPEGRRATSDEPDELAAVSDVPEVEEVEPPRKMKEREVKGGPLFKIKWAPTKNVCSKCRKGNWECLLASNADITACERCRRLKLGCSHSHGKGVRREKRGSGPTTEVGSDSEVAPRPSKRRREVSPESGLPALPPREVLPTRTSEMRLLVEQLERDNVRMWQRMAASEDRTRVLYELLAMLRGVGGREGELAAIDDMLRRAMVEFPLGRPLPARVRYVLEGSESEEEPEEKPEESEESEEERSDLKGKGKARSRPEERRREKPKTARGSGRRRRFSGVQVPTRREARLAEIANDLFPPPLNTEGLIRFPPKEEDDPMGRAEIGGAEGGEVVSSEVAKEASPVAGTSGTRKTPTPEPTNEDARRSPSEVREEAPRMEVDGGAPTESEVTAGDVEMGGVAPEIGGGAPTASEVEKGGDEGETEPFGPGGDVVV